MADIAAASSIFVTSTGEHVKLSILLVTCRGVVVRQLFPSSAPCADALAINGGSAVRLSPPTPWPVFAEDEIAGVVETLRSGKVNQWTGEQVNEFERKFAVTLGRPRALALANGTVALETILRACDIGPGDEVIVTP